MNAEPRHIAQAIAELGREATLEARAYLDAWDSLTRSSVPVHTVRHLLDREHVATEAMSAVGNWTGRGQLMLVGPRGVGKSIAAAEWMRRRHVAGRAGCWLTMASWQRLTWDEQRAHLDRAARATWLVVDDWGAAGSVKSDDALAKLNGLLLERFGESKPTILVANGTEADLLSKLDGRVVDRLREAGEIAAVGGPPMRANDTDEIGNPACPCGARGSCTHGARWRVAHELVEVMGCEHGPQATGEWMETHDGRSSWTPHTGPTREEWRVGFSLIEGARNRENKRARELLPGVARDDVLELADKMARKDNAPELLNLLEEAMIGMVGSCSAKSTALADEKIGQVQESQVRARMLRDGSSYNRAMLDISTELTMTEAVAEGARADNLARARTVQEGLRMGGEPSGKPWSPREASKPPRWTQGDDGRKKLRGCGFEVKGSPGRVRVLHNEQTKAVGLPTVDAGWAAAAAMASGYEHWAPPAFAGAEGAHGRAVEFILSPSE